MAWMLAAAMGAFFVKGLSGFANTLVFNTLLSFKYDNINISPVELLLGYPSNIILAWKERKKVQWKIALPLAIMVILGSIPGAILLKNTDVQIVKAIFGVVVMVIGIEMFFREKQKKKSKESKKVLVFIGILSGVLCGLYGIGALLAAYLSRVTDNTRAFKANICIVFIVENTFRIITYIITGIISYEVLKQVILLIPAMLIGLFIGIKSSTFINERIVKKVVILMLVVSGFTLFINNIRI